MRKRFSKHLRKEILRLGWDIISEGTLVKSGERKIYKIPKHKQGYEVIAKYEGWTYHVAHEYDALGAYRYLLKMTKEHSFANVYEGGGVAWVI